MRGVITLLLAWSMVCVTPMAMGAKTPFDDDITADEIVSKCNYKNPGQDQRSRLTIVLRDAQQNERRSVYRRLWKSYDANGSEIADKMVLFTEYPPDAKGAAFMRWAYEPEASKHAEQWIYLPVLRKIRRVSIRDLSDSFLGSDLTYGDISLRRVSQDRHNLVKTVQGRSGQFFVVVSEPKESSSQYSKKVQWFRRAPQWDHCLNLRTDYYDRKGELLKRQFLKWQKIKDAWVWDRVIVENVQTYHASMFIVDQVEVNVGLDDDVFTERTLRLRR